MKIGVDWKSVSTYICFIDREKGSPMQIEVKKLEREIHEGDWHDAPLRWQVVGPANEIQNFSTKKDALRYKSIRRKAADFNEASKQYARS